MKKVIFCIISVAAAFAMSMTTFAYSVSVTVYHINEQNEPLEGHSWLSRLYLLLSGEEFPFQSE